MRPAPRARRSATTCVLLHLTLAVLLLVLQQTWLTHRVVHAAEASSKHAATLQAPVDACGVCAMTAGGQAPAEQDECVASRPPPCAHDWRSRAGVDSPVLRFYNSQAPPLVS